MNFPDALLALITSMAALMLIINVWESLTGRDGDDHDDYY